MDGQRSHITRDCLIQIFTFFNDEYLSNASLVCKDWHEAAETPWLWRRMCLQRWGFCNTGQAECERSRQAWKRYYLRRSHLESKMSTGRSGSDYTCKSLRGHTGRVVGLLYLEENAAKQPDLLSGNATICSASTDGTVRSWDVQKAEQRWCSPVQSPLTGLVSDREHGILITADSAGLIKAWQGQSGQELASYSAGSPHCTLLQYNINNNSFLSVGTSGGTVCTLVCPELSVKSSLLFFDGFHVNILLNSPDKKWVLAGVKNNEHFSPKVICAESLTSPSEEEDPLCQWLPSSGCQAAVFIPTQPARLASIHHTGRSSNKALTVVDVDMKKTKCKREIHVQQVGSFTLGLSSRAPEILLAAKDSGTLIVAADRELWIYSLKGECLGSFKDHTGPIPSICVDSFRVVTASRDLSLRVLIWKNDSGKGPFLESRYHLLGGSHTMSRGFTHVACDFSSIVASVEATDGKDAIKAYVFTS